MEMLNCPFCGGTDGKHELDCYMELIGRNIDALIDGADIPISVERLDEAWNHRYERTCKHVPDREGSWFNCSECGFWVDWYTGDTNEVGKINHCPGCGAKVVSE